jgi:hypothetical protein
MENDQKKKKKNNTKKKNNIKKKFCKIRIKTIKIKIIIKRII